MKRAKRTVMTFTLDTSAGWWTSAHGVLFHIRLPGDDQTVCGGVIFRHKADVPTLTDRLDERIDPTTVPVSKLCRICLARTILGRPLARIEKVEER